MLLRAGIYVKTDNKTQKKTKLYRKFIRENLEIFLSQIPFTQYFVYKKKNIYLYARIKKNVNLNDKKKLHE